MTGTRQVSGGVGGVTGKGQDRGKTRDKTGGRDQGGKGPLGKGRGGS